MNEFPRWSGPIVGAIIGGLLGLKAGAGGNMPGGIIWYVAGGIAMGFLAGCLVFLLDRKPESSESAAVEALQGGRNKVAPNGQNVPEPLPYQLPVKEQHPVNAPSGIIGRFLALITCLIFWIPIAGVLFSIASCIVNRNAGDWTIKVSAVFGVVALLITVLTFLML